MATSTDMAEQLSFDLHGMPALGREDFLVAPSNAMAVSMINSWPNWAGGKLAVSGPEGSGKTHLAHVWAQQSGATIVHAGALRVQDVPMLASGHVAVENVPDIAASAEGQTALFHLHNLVLAEGHSLMLTGAGPVPHWGSTLPDLASRMAGTTHVELLPPDDALLGAVLGKLFADRQLTPPPTLIPYLIGRMDRSFAAAQSLVAALDERSLAQKKPITRSLAAGLLDNTHGVAR